MTDPDGRWMDDSGHITDTTGQTSGFLGSSYKPQGATNYLGVKYGDGGGENSTTIGGIMKNAGITLGSLESLMQLKSVLNLRQQLIDAGFTTPEKIKAMYNQKDALLKKVPALANIYKYFTKETPIEFQEGGTDAPGQLLSSTNIVALNMDKIDNILHLSFTLGHEMLHLYDSYFVNRSLREYFGNGTIGTSAILLYNEYRSYSWMVSLGYKTKSGNDLNILNIIKFGYADKLNTDKSELGTKAYNLFLEKYNFLDSIYKIP
ncbi:hypothetical protein [Chryseobacterium sp. JV558]|uniref:hypothetical protein n=1 Tax=Chryseobacterium sp. JV558 TaxID=2663236 RepID=UPI00299D4857|nr:hypothetical protein [Chryseobacterium sp. JV558]MDW9379163.1 hypothetical protein [Chryseobacterium sp. JV558]